MAKSSKKSKEAIAQESSALAPGMESNNGHQSTDSAKLVTAKKTATKPTVPAKSTGKGRGVAVKKPSVPRKPRDKKTADRSFESTVTDEEIRIRAYFISEWRTQNGVAGDSAHDWLEARRQLQSEAASA